MATHKETSVTNEPEAPKSIEELKAHAYDTARLLGVLQQELQQTNEAIAQAEAAKAASA